MAPHIWFFHYWAKAVCALFFRVVLRKGFESPKIHEHTQRLHEHTQRLHEHTQRLHEHTQRLHEHTRRPRLYALNHTNSFLDPVLFAVQRRHPLHFLARGDVLYGFAWGILPRIFPLLPVWRKREGQAQLKGNYSTFERCFEVWKQDGAVVIFSEGLCLNRVGLKPLLKGTARLVWQSYERGLDLEVVPVGVCYEHFNGTGKAARVSMGAPLEWRNLAQCASSPAHFYQSFNAALASAMADCMVDPEETGSAANFWSALPPRRAWQRMARLLSAVLHFPIAAPARLLSKALTQGTVHFDSVYFVVLMLAYPFSLLLLLVVGIGFFPAHALVVCLWVGLLPAIAWMGR